MFVVALAVAWSWPPAARAAGIAIPCADTAALIDGIVTANATPLSDTISLAANCTYQAAAVDNNADGPNAFPSITSPITIQGNGATIRVSSPTLLMRVLHVGANGNLTLANVKVSGGALVNSFVCSGGIRPTAVGPGGLSVLDDLSHSGAGIANRGQLTLVDSTVRGNAAGVGGGIASIGPLTLTRSVVENNTASTGGGIAASGTLTIVDSGINQNQGAPGTGGIVAEGLATLTNSTVDGNGTCGRQGGIETSGAMTLNGTTVSNSSGSGITNRGTLTLIDSRISDNIDGYPSGQGGFGDGAGINNSGVLSITGSTIDGNMADGYGGGVFSSGTLTVTNSTFSGNIASGSGGGIFGGGAVTLASTTITTNTADFNANGLGDGGGVALDTGTVAHVRNTIIAGNFDTPGNAGPGNIYPDVAGFNATSLTVIARLSGAPPQLFDVCIAGPSYPTPNCLTYYEAVYDRFTWQNLVPGTYTVTERDLGPGWQITGAPQTVAVDLFSSPVVTIVNTFVGINMFLPLVMNGAGGPAVAARTSEARLSNMAAQATASDAGVFASDGYNLIGDGSGGEFANGVGGDKVGAAASPLDARLAPLANNGGPTQTHALLSGSPAIDAANPAAPGSGGNACPPADQRGVARPQGPRCDIGAFERT
jgi:predicted outer membrane repeat protein